MAQQNNGNDLEKLYKAVSEKFNIGDYDSFLSKMQTTEDRLRFYNAVREKGYNLGDYNDYESRLGKSLEVPVVGSADTSVESVEPTSPTEVSPSAPTESSPTQNATSSEQSLTGDQFLSALNKRNRDIAGLTGLEDVLSRQTEVVIPEGTEIIPNAVGPDGLPVYAKLNEDGTYTQGGAILAPIDLAPTLKDIEEQQKPTPWQSVKNSISNIGNQLQGFDDRLTIFTTDIYEKIFGKDLGGKIYAFLDDGLITGLPGQDGDKEDLLRRRREEAYEELRRLGEEALPTLGITDSFNSGRIENLAAGIVNAVSAVAGTAIVSVPTGGAGLFTEMGGGFLYDYNTEKAESKGITTKELIDSGEADFWTPFTISLIGGGLERAGFSGITKSIMRNLSGSVAKKAVVLGLDWNKEASTEWVQGGLEAYNKAIAQGGTHEQAIESMSSRMASEEGLEEYLMGLFGSAGATTIGRLSKGVINKASKDKIRKNANEIQTMVSDMSKTTDPSTRSSLLEVISEKANEILSAKQESNDIESQLTDEQKTEVNELTSIIDSIDDGLANSELSDVSTEALNARKAELEKQVDKIITTREPSTDIAPEAVDKRIQDFRDNNPNVELDDPMDSIPESVDRVMSRIDDNLPVDPVSAKETSDTLYAKYKELSDMKKDPNRTLTIAEIDGYMEQLESDIETLENYTTEGTPVQEQTQENETTETEIQPETTQEVSEVSLESSEVAPVGEATAVTEELVVDDSKQRQFEIIQASNPAPNAVNTWVRSPEDILTAEEAFTPPREDGAIYPDFSVEDMDVALSSGEVTVYSSYPIVNGVFVTPSKMNAESYSGGGKVYSKTIPISDVAWIDEGEGQYAPVSTSEPVAEGPRSVQTEIEQSSSEVEATAKALEGLQKENSDKFVNDFVNIDIPFRQENIQAEMDSEVKKQLFPNEKTRRKYAETIYSAVVRSNNFPKILSEAYHKAKVDGSNPELVETVEKLIGNNNQSSLNTQTEAQTSTPVIKTEPRPSETAIPRQDMPPNNQDNPRLKSLIRALPRQDTAEMRGPANVEYRRDVIESITGERPAKKDAGITNVRRAIADYLGIDLENTSGADFADMVRNWANSPDSSPKKSSAQQPVAQAQSSGTQLDPNTVSIPVSDITTDEASFQNRESLDSERVDNIVNNFNEVKFDPIVVYNDDGKMVVLSGHHRFAAAQRMGMKNIPSREFKGTREEAIEFARDSNTLSRPETSVERASRYRDMRSKGESESSIRDKARAAHGSEATKILNLSRLSENGKALEAIRSFQDSTDTDTRNKVEAIGDWIGNVKSRHPDISTRQENEMFDYLMDKYGTKKKSGSVTNRSQFFDIANALVDRLKNRGDFNPESVLNFNNAAGKSGIEIEYDETLAEAKENVAKARKALDDARARAVSEGMNPDRMNKVLAPLEENLRNAIADEQAVRAQKGKLQEAVRAQTSIFDIINQNEEQIESNAAIEREVQSAFDGEPTENTEASRSYQEVRQESPTEERVESPTDDSQKPDQTADKPAKPRTPKTLLKGVADRLSKTGLAKSVTIKNSQEISEDLSSRGNIQFQTDATELAEIEARAKADGTWMKAPNGKPTNLNKKQWVQVRSKAFKDWFGDWENDPQNASKVVDENGEPLVVYHGTESEFTEFEPTKPNFYQETEGWYFFTDKKESAKTFGKNVMSVFLNIDNPTIETTGYFNTWNLYDDEGNYGFIAPNTDTGNGGVANQYVVENPNQIKSATDNVGAFDGSNPDIRYQSSGSDVRGYVDAEGNIVINSDTAGLDTPIHEFAHIWERTIEKTNPLLHAQGMELIAGPDGKPYVDHVRQTQPGLEGRELYKEALAQAIGDRGARLIESQKQGPIKEWLKRAWEFIGNLVGISSMSPSEIAGLTLEQYADAAAVDLLKGKPIAKLPSGDVAIKTTARTESEMDDADKFMADFVSRMKQKNGVNFQGNVSGGLSTDDFKDLTRYFRYAIEKGQISTLSDARLMARSMGISSPADVDMAFKLAKTRGSGAVGFKKSEVSEETIANTDFAKMTDEEYREMGRSLVEQGLVNPNELVAEIIQTPRALQPWEVTALQYYRSNIESEMAEISSKLDSNDANYTYRVGGETLTGYKAMAQRMAFINEALFDLEVAMLTTANQQSAAFRLRSVMADKDFNIVQFLAEMKARGAIDPDLEQKLINLSNELNVVRAKLKEKSKEVDELQERIAVENINYTAQQPTRTRRVKPKKEVLATVEMTLDTIDPSAFGLPGMSFQANNTILFQTNPNPSLSDAVANAIATMRSNISEGKMNIADAIEQAVSDVDAAIGKGNWDSMKFKSEIANKLVGQGVAVQMKAPYVNTNGRLIVPGAYITNIAREGADTLDKMVQRVNDDLGGRFSEYDIRNAISGYGRQTAKTRTDLDRAISKAKRIAKLLSEIEDLETKGQRLKTRKQVDNNDAEIEALKQQVKMLEYDLEMTPEERDQLAEQRYNENRRKYLRSYIDNLQERIKNKDFAPKRRKNKYEEDNETQQLRAEAERIKNEFKKEKYRHELETRPIDEKIRGYAYDLIFNITRALSAGFDASAIGVQALIFSAARPKQALDILRSSMKGSFSEAEYDAYFANLQADPLYEVARKAKLNLQLPNFYQSVQEEQFKGSIPAYLLDYLTGGAGEFVAKMRGGDVVKARQFAQDKFNLAKIADRNYSLVLSKVRMELFREFVTNQVNKRGLDVELDAAEVARIAEVVNTITMASKVPGVESKTANDITSMIMFSARKFVATWKILGAWIPLAINNRQLLKDAYGGVIGRGLGTLFTIAALPNIMGTLMAAYGDEDDEEDNYWYNKHWLNPKHSDFLKIRLGNTRISLFNGIDGNIVFATRFLSREYMTSSSEAVKELGGASNNKTPGGLSWEYISNKFAPTTSILTNRFLYSDREKQESYERFKESFAPMWVTSMYEQYVKTGNVGETMALGAAGFFGLAYNNYGGAEFAIGPGTDNIKVRRIFDRSGLSAYDPGNGVRKYFDGERETAVKGKNYKDVYLPAYKEFMREAVLSHEKNLSPGKHWEYKEGLVNNFKKEAYKHAELELSGVVFTSAFKDISYDGQKYVIPKSLYKLKADYIKQYMDEYSRDLALYKEDIKYEFSEREGVKPTDRYLEMLAKNELYKEAQREANQRMIDDMEMGKIKLIPKDEYVSSDDNFEDE